MPNQQEPGQRPVSFRRRVLWASSIHYSISRAEFEDSCRARLSSTATFAWERPAEQWPDHTGEALIIGGHRDFARTAMNELANLSINNHAVTIERFARDRQNTFSPAESAAYVNSSSPAEIDAVLDRIPMEVIFAHLQRALDNNLIDDATIAEFIPFATDVLHREAMRAAEEVKMSNQEELKLQRHRPDPQAPAPAAPSPAALISTLSLPPIELAISIQTVIDRSTLEPTPIIARFSRCIMGHVNAG
ncbi:hypothetical protein B0I35DRAFT_514637 [Stachybotrys elegans]|uniref:Uncharacterized protein n=1 Tax=Stachybotrys elegans TaxID=80388 RepID=A0A8K0WP51_9HYPO|nr:hypothetical protein B0I35DRAFT_514637 [Stachybotrys elegans]